MGQLTLSGNEITDAVRSASTQGDGLVVPSGIGIWESTTNLCTNGGFESNTTGWDIFQPGTTIARVTTGAKFGSAAAQITLDGTTSNQGVFYNYIYTAGTTYTLSAWVNGPVGSFLVIGYSAAQQQYTLTGAWQRITYTWTAGSGDSRLYVIEGTHQQTMSFLLDGVQIEQKPFATPYVETNGATATRNPARVQAPASLLNATQGWVAGKLKMGWSSTVLHYGDPLMWGDDSSNRINVYVGGGQWTLLREAAGIQDLVTVTSSFNAGDTKTVIAAWDSGHIYLSIDGAAFVSAVSTHIPSLVAALFDIGSGGSISANEFIDSNSLWFACGTGTLTNQDAATLYGYGNTPPILESFASTAQATAAMPMFDSNYIDYPLIPVITGGRK